ncbi:hypothetical protein NOVOSPHI9U_730003 [Novosphingobium sp. 9U]|nr:hypothetical protein NOVOSPHI9U_730003 [Novosphingobium sp. 9U]
MSASRALRFVCRSLIVSGAALVIVTISTTEQTFRDRLLVVTGVFCVLLGTGVLRELGWRARPSGSKDTQRPHSAVAVGQEANLPYDEAAE